MSDSPHFQQIAQTTIDLHIIQGQLDTIESALLMAWRHMGRAIHTQEQERQLSDAIDTAIAVKRSFKLTSDLIPVKEQQSASFTERVCFPIERRQGEQ